MSNKNPVHYFVEGKCEEKFINAFKIAPDFLFVPGKVEVFNFIIIQALKALGDSNINDGILLKMSDKLNMHEKENLLENLRFAPVWMHKYLKFIGDLNNEKHR